MLLDAGGVPVYGSSRSGIDIGEDVVSPYLWTRSIKRLDVVAVSHLHEDHAGGLAAVLRNFRPAEVWTGALPRSSEQLRLRELAQAEGAQLRLLSGGQQWEYGGARLTVLASRHRAFTVSLIAVFSPHRS